MCCHLRAAVWRGPVAEQIKTDCCVWGRRRERKHWTEVGPVGFDGCDACVFLSALVCLEWDSSGVTPRGPSYLVKNGGGGGSLGSVTFARFHTTTARGYPAVCAHEWTRADFIIGIKTAWPQCHYTQFYVVLSWYKLHQGEVICSQAVWRRVSQE